MAFALDIYRKKVNHIKQKDKLHFQCAEEKVSHMEKRHEPMKNKQMEPLKTGRRSLLKNQQMALVNMQEHTKNKPTSCLVKKQEHTKKIQKAQIANMEHTKNRQKKL